MCLVTECGIFFQKLAPLNPKSWLHSVCIPLIELNQLPLCSKNTSNKIPRLRLNKQK